VKIINASFVISSPAIDKCPEIELPEYAFIGRSNVGKSSLINMLTNKVGLAKTSGTPGKTQLINHFEIQSISSKDTKQKWYLVDLPGYGYAKIAQSQRKVWQKMISNYLQKRKNLAHIFVLIDSRHKPQQIDLEFINQLGEWQLPFAIVFTKSDKEKQAVVAANVKAFMQKLKENWEELPGYFVTSSVKKTGMRQLLEAIGIINNELI
jgi:GTP-binding protein